MPSLNEKISSSEKRIQSLQKTLSKNGSYWIENSSDLFYLTSRSISKGTFFILKDSAHLFVDGRYFDALCDLKHLNLHRSETEKFLPLFQKNNIQEILFDGALLCFDRVEALKKELGLAVIHQEGLLDPFRRIKDEKELLILKENAKLLYKSFEETLGHLKEGLSEEEVATLFKIEALKQGATGFSFEPIIAFGENSAFPHHRSGKKILKKGDIVLIDIGVEKNHYQSDMTRIAFFGNVSKDLLKLHDVVLAAHDAALKKCKKGTALKELDLAARQVMKKEGVESYFTHGLGHGIGIDTHESPRIRFDGKDKDLILESGMVITIEPGLYLKGLGGVRYEDTIAITDEGYENFFPEKHTTVL